MKQVYLLSICLCCVVWAQAQNPAPVQFASGPLSFPSNFQDLLKTPAPIQPEEVLGRRYVRYIQFSRMLSDAERAMGESAGVQFLQYYAPYCYLVSLPESFELQQLAALPVYGILPPVDRFKMAPQLLERPLGAWAVQGDQVLLNVQVYPHIGIDEGARLCTAAGITVLQKGAMNGYLQVKVPLNALENVAAQPFVEYVELIAPPSAAEDIRNRALHRSNLIDADYAGGLHFNGAGVKALVRDDGKVGPHEDFRGRLTDLSNTNLGNHGDWVTGVMAGAGNINPLGRGMANGVDIYVAEYESSFQDDKLMQLLGTGIPITNSSYSDGCNIGYTLGSQTVDQQMVNYPLLTHVFSAGNSGTSNCNYGAGGNWGNITGGHKMAKNSIAVANLLADGSLNSSSSRGPAYDGRIKPDISAHGTDVFMTQPYQTYSTATGTSFSAPAVAGGLAQLTQAYKSMHNGQEPESALIKASVLNTANDLGNVGPDFRFGWGQINVARAYQLLADQRFSKKQISQAAVSTQTLQVPDQTRQARFMIVWTDPAAAPNAGKALVNDLDLKVIAPDGTVLLPWVLDPTPTVTALNTPATRGVDALNNVEQVHIENPVPGNYTVQVDGSKIAFGPQSFYLVWVYLKDEIKITYPAGGEGFVPDGVERIYWDALDNTGSFTLQYSLNNGADWNPLTTVSGERRFFDWNVPVGVVSSQVKLMLQRDAQVDTTDAPFSIAPVPGNIKVEKVCPDSMRISWTPVADTLEYDVYLLGKKYMEVVGHTKQFAYTFPLQNGGEEQWISLRCADSSGLAGRRANALYWPGNLKNCTQPNDVALRQLIAPAVDAIIQCGGSDQQIAVKIKNEGLNPITGAVAHYQVGNQAIVSEPVPDIPVQDSLSFVFATPFYVGINGKLDLKIWVSYPNDNAPYNDTIQRVLPVISQSTQTTFGQNFENSPNVPAGWTVVNPDQQVGWELQRSTIIGTSGTSSRAFWLDCYDYPDLGAEDYIYLIPMDLSIIANPTLFFDVAYAQYDASSSEALRVEVFKNCDLNAIPEVIWQKSGSDLASTPPTTGSFVPTQASQWNNEAVDLSAYVGQSILVRFASVSNYGNNMYLDNVRLLNYVAAVPNADFMASTDTICRLDTMQFVAINQDLATTNLTWNFGLQAQPTTATGPGPHSVWYVTPGAKNVRLIASNPFGIDTLVQKIVVRSFPTANFSTQVVDLTVAFTNTSQNATSFFWDFGDGQTSTQAEPLHTYAAPGSYTVKLRATNPCKTIEKSATVLTVLKTDELSKSLNVSVLPNPTSGDFKVNLQLSQPLGDVRLRLLDAQGRQIKVQKMTLKQGENIAAFEGLQLPKGVYQLMVDTNVGVKTLKVVVE